jgi:hypothetical protein
MKNAALVIQGMAGFDPFLAGVFERFQQHGMFPDAITTEGASISPAIWFATGKPMAEFLEKVRRLHQFSTSPEAVFMGLYSNGYFHSTNMVDYIRQIMQGKMTSLYTYHFYPDVEKEEQVRKAMKIPVYTGIINLESGEHAIKNLREFSSSKHYRWLGGRIPYFTPTEIDGEIFVEDYYRNPPLKPLIKNPDIKRLIFIRSFSKHAKIPSNYMELQDRDISFTMNSYFDRELDFLENVNQWVREGKLPESDYRIIDSLCVDIAPEPLDYLDYTRKGITAKYELGLEKGDEILEKYSQLK